MKKTLKMITKTIYGTIVLVVVAMALLFIGTKIDVLGYELRVVKSGSMEPVIPTGSVVLIMPSETYAVGDVVTYHTGAAGSIPVTHRIMKKTEGEQQTYYATKGDANEDMDPSPVSHPRVMGKVALHIPFIGYAIEFARTPLGFALLIGIPAALIILDEFATIIWEFRKYFFARRKESSKDDVKGNPRQEDDGGEPMIVAREFQTEVAQTIPVAPPARLMRDIIVRRETPISFTPKSVLERHKVRESRRPMIDMCRYELKRSSS